MPTKHLPSNPDLGHLRHQAKDLMRARNSGEPEECQLIREFVARFAKSSDAEIVAARFTLSDAQFAIARAYGFASWARLKSHIERPGDQSPDLPYHEQIKDANFREAVDLLDSGDEDGLRDHLKTHPEILRQRVEFEGGNYFRNPSLLEFCAENPIRHGSLPANIVQMVLAIMEAGEPEKKAIDSTLGLVSSGCVARECAVQIPLIELLCSYGASPDQALQSALVHGEFEATEALIHCGATADLPFAAALGHFDEAVRLLPRAKAGGRHLALAYSVQFGHSKIVRLLLDSGEDPNRYNPAGSHSHSTPLHQAAFYGHMEVIALLLAKGADPNLKDLVYGGTPLGWAEHGTQTEAASLLRDAKAP
jgi:hypothetical protein